MVLRKKLSYYGKKNGTIPKTMAYNERERERERERGERERESLYVTHKTSVTAYVQLHQIIL